jgi:FAD/FMN-containing dehydrogenase
VKYASAYNFPFLSKSGGHGFATTFGRLRNGLQIDMGSFDSISVDEAGSTATIGGGVLIGNVAGPLYDAGKELRKLQVVLRTFWRPGFA